MKKTIKHILSEARKYNLHREVDLYAKRIIHMNDGIDSLYAYELAYQEHDTRRELKDQGYSDIHAKRLAGSIRYGIY